MSQSPPNFSTQQNTRRTLTAISSCLGISAVVAGCTVCLSSPLPIPIENPLVLIAASLFLLGWFKSETPAVLQKLTAIYLIGVIVNEISVEHFRVGVLGAGVTVSWSMPILLLFLAAYLVDKLGSIGNTKPPQSRLIVTAWIVALALLIAQMTVLGPILYRFYGYGYERDLAVAGSLCLYLPLFLILRRSLAGVRFRRLTGLVLIIFFLVVQFVQK